ncbi:MAG: hypothetical protein Q4A64_04950 [Porphyromonadaceae bacterium]|nr:hypothetical protein [Porphyromonadaceae bacterium]
MSRKKKELFWGKYEITKFGVRVDAYHVNLEDAETYCRDREALAERATRFFETFCFRVSRDWAGSEDGEAIVGYNRREEIIALIHLDPLGIQMHTENPDDRAFEDELLYHNEIDRDDLPCIALKAREP